MIEPVVPGPPLPGGALAERFLVPRAVLDLECHEPPEEGRGAYERLLRGALRAEEAGRPDEALAMWAEGRRRARLAWTDRLSNLVTTVGKNDVGEVYFRAGAQRTSWYVGLATYSTGTTFAPASSDTMASHTGWVEVTAYSNSTRQALVLAPFAAGASDNSASPVSFLMNATFAVVGGFLCSSAAKGSTTPLLYNIITNTGTVNTGGSGSTLTGVMSLTMA